MGSPNADCYEFGPFRLDAVKRLLWRKGELVLLRPKTMKMLQVLVENSTRVVKKEELMNAVWADTAVEDNNLTVHISALRRILGGLRNEHRYIVTVPGQGYQFVAPVREVTGDAGENARQEIAPARSLSETTQQAVLSIAVFPFRNSSGTEGENDLGLGMADALITGLSHMPQVAVRPTSAVLSYVAP